MTDDTGAQSPFDVPPPDPELRRLQPLLGSWTAQETTQDSVLGPGVPVTSTERFSCSTAATSSSSTTTPSSVTRLPSGASTTGITTPRQAGSGSSSSVTTATSPRKAIATRARVAGSKLIFQGPARFAYELDDDGKVKVNPDGTISVD